MSTTLLQGDCREVLKTLAPESVHAVVTSPPYFQLRSYLPEGHPDKPSEIGSEPTLGEFVSTMVSVFREVRRVLRRDGVLWLNLGDSYAGGGRGGGGSFMAERGDTSWKSKSHARRGGTTRHSCSMASSTTRGTRRRDCRQRSTLRPCSAMSSGRSSEPTPPSTPPRQASSKFAPVRFSRNRPKTLALVAASVYT